MKTADSKPWEKTVRRLEQLLRLRSFPVAFRMLESRAELDGIPFLRRPGKKTLLCQLISQVRSFDWTVGAELSDFLNSTCPSILGLCDIPETSRDGTFRSIVWVKTKQEGRKYEAAIPRLPLGRYEALAMGPLVYSPFEPQIVLLYANPAQMILLINALQFERYEVMQFHCVGESSCSDAIARCYRDGKPSLTIPCYGERRYGHAQDDELVMALPPAALEQALAGLEALYRRGVRYPISYAGAEQDLTSAFPAAYGGMEQLQALRGTDGRLLLGVTGGIASGKSTVAEMLAELGAPMIDFDLLARRVVEPGRPAWQEIVDFFGRQILDPEERIDRKALSRIVFRDLEKRKRLESFTHPRILAEFLRQVNELAAGHPGAIIQAVVPLLLELNLQYMFHRVVVVHVPPETQLQRLMERDGIDRGEAADMLKAQMPIDEKTGYADFVIRNDGSREETRRRVEALWRELQRLQAGREGGTEA